MARNMYPGYCYKCGAYVPIGYGHFELIRRRTAGYVGLKWRIQCVKCASGKLCLRRRKSKQESEKKSNDRCGFNQVCKEDTV